MQSVPDQHGPMIGAPSGVAGDARPDHVDLILQRVDALPTLSPVAARVLRLSGSDETELREIIEVVESDPTLSARLISLCRRSDRGVTVATVDRAVMLLGMDAVRAALLSIQVFELLGPGDEPDSEGPARPVDRRQLWLYALAAGCAAEVLAETLPGGHGAPKPGEAYLCGLLHDLGKVVLDRILPRAFAKCVDIAEQQRVDFAVVARRVMGVDHFMVGKRLAERWNLPLAMQDAMWLHDHPPERLPTVAHTRTLELVIGGVALARSLHLGWSGAFRAGADLTETLRACGVPTDDLDWYRREVNDRVALRASTLGLMDDADQSLLVVSINNANRELGRLHELAVGHARSARSAARAMAAITAFRGRSMSGGSVISTIESVAHSAQSMLGGRPVALLWQHREGAGIEVLRFGDGESVMLGGSVSSEDAGIELGAVRDRHAHGLRNLAARALGDVDWSSCVIVPMTPGNGSGGALVHRPENPDEVDWEAIDALAGVWSMALAASAQHDGARRLAEDLARANTDLQRATETMAKTRTLAHLSEVAAGAAHEMNNPLTVISGQAQILLRQADSMRERASATAVIEAAHTLSELIADLHFFARPPAPALQSSSVSDVVSGAIARAVRLGVERGGVDESSDSAIVPEIPVDIGSVLMDPDQIGLAVTEVVLNAIQAEPKGSVSVRVHRDAAERRLVIAVEDDGAGMSEHTLSHAFDPFFSARPAGRRSGLGLARARRLVELHGGTIRIRSEAGVGTEVWIALPTDGACVDATERSAA